MRSYKRWVGGAVLVGFILALAVGLAGADRNLRQLTSMRAPLRVYVGAVAQQYDTLAVTSGERVELVTFSLYGDDSAQATGVGATFMSLNSKTVYGRLTDSYTSSQNKTTSFTGPWVFPKDSTILIYYNMLAAGALDTLLVQATYRLERF